MSYTIGSETDFYNWDSLTYPEANLTNNITISTANAPVIMNSNSTFNGRNYTIDIDIGRTNIIDGLFTTVDNTCRIQNLYVTATSGTISSYNGWLVSSNLYNPAGLIINVSLVVSTTVDVVLLDNSGGMVGRNNAILTIDNCFYQGPIAQYSGGFIGPGAALNGNTTITSCFANIVGNVSSNTGGIVGMSAGSITYNCYILYCAVNAVNAIYNGYSALFVGPTSNNIIVANCYVYANLIMGNSADNISGFFGYDCQNCTITSSYFYNTGPIFGSNTNSFFTIINESSSISNQIQYCFTTTSSFDGSPGDTTIVGSQTSYNSGVDSPPVQFDSSVWNLTVNPPTLKNFVGLYWGSYNVFSDVPILLRCILKGSMVMTPSGNKLIETLKTGDEVVTLDGTTIIEKITKTYVVAKGNFVPYLIPKDYYGENCPFQNLYLSRYHMIYNNGILYHTKHKHRKSNLSGMVTYYHLKTSNSRDIIYVNGLTLEVLGSTYKCVVCASNRQSSEKNILIK